MNYNEECEAIWQAEIEAGRRAVALYGKIEKVDKQTKILNEAFPRLTIAAVLNKPYTHVTVRARAQFLAPIASTAVLTSDEYASYNEVTFEDPLDDYPTDYLVTQLALIS